VQRRPARLTRPAGPRPLARFRSRRDRHHGDRSERRDQSTEDRSRL